MVVVLFGVVCFGWVLGDDLFVYLLYNSVVHIVRYKMFARYMFIYLLMSGCLLIVFGGWQVVGFDVVWFWLDGILG